MSHAQLLNNLSKENIKAPSKLSPRVMGGVELNILKTQRSPKTARTESRDSLPGAVKARVSPTEGLLLTSPGSVSSGETTASQSTDGRTRKGRTDRQIQTQLQTYMAWINSQLKKKPGARLIEDLRNDTRDGVAFINLVEVVARDSITGYHPVPSTYGEMKDNVERVLHYMSSKRIRMHHILAKDIVDGNLKSIMRLILALAAHFKPNSVKHSSQQSRSGDKSPNLTGIAQGASATLAAARRTVAKAGTSFRRHREYRRRTYRESSSDQFSDSDQSTCGLDHSRHHVVPRDRGEVDGASASSSPTASMVHSPQTSICTSTPISNSASRPRMGDVSLAESAEESKLDGSMPPVMTQHQSEDLSELFHLTDSMKLIKKDLSSLQDLLLSGQPPDGEEAKPGHVIEGTSLKEQIVILKSQLLQSQNISSELREEISKYKLDSLQVQGVKLGLQQRLTEQDETIAQLKADLLRRDFEKQNFESERANLTKQLQDKDKMIQNLRKEIGRREQGIDHLQNKLRLQIHEKDNTVKSLQLQIKDLHDRFRVVGETGASLSARVASQDKKMAKLAGKILHTQPDPTGQGRPVPEGPGHGIHVNTESAKRSRCFMNPVPWAFLHRQTENEAGTDDLTVLRDSLSSLRLSFVNTDPQQHTIDTLEQAVSSLMERLPNSNNSSQSSGSQSPYDAHVSRKLNFDSTGDVRRSPITAIPGSGSTSFSVQKLDSSPTINGQSSTKVLYFTENTPTPHMLTICKRLGEITLKDFKAMFDRPSQYRYHFKALDPEFGTVKEEISNEDTVIPGWEGKIVAWLEEDTHEAEHP